RLVRVGDDSRDRVTCVAGPITREWHVLRAVHPRHRDEHGEHAGGLRVLAGHDGNDAGLLARGRRVDATDPRVRMRTPYQRDVDHTGQGHVIGEDAATPDEPRIFLARRARADVGGRCGSGHLFTSAHTFIGVVAPRISVAAERIALTMLW